MNRTKVILIVVAGVLSLVLPLVLPVVSYQLAVRKAMRAPQVRHPDIYHLPSSDAQCLPGYLKVPGAFSRGDVTWDGCWNGYAPPNIDFLLDDENVSLGAVVRTR